MRNVFPRLTTQSTVADSNDDRLFVHVSSPHNEVTNVVVPVRAPESRGPHRRGRRRARSEGSDFGYVTLIDSSDEDAPFAVPTRRVALVSEPEDTSQSFPDMHRTSSQGAEPRLSWIQPTLTATVLLKCTRAFWTHWKMTFSLGYASSNSLDKAANRPSVQSATLSLTRWTLLLNVLRGVSRRPQFQHPLQ